MIQNLIQGHKDISKLSAELATERKQKLIYEPEAAEGTIE